MGMKPQHVTPPDWAIVLAGGDGIRLEGLTSKIDGDSSDRSNSVRPKSPEMSKRGGSSSTTTTSSSHVASPKDRVRGCQQTRTLEVPEPALPPEPAGRGTLFHRL